MFKIIYSFVPTFSPFPYPFTFSFVILHILIDKALITTKKLLHSDAKSYYLKIIKWIPILIKSRKRQRAKEYNEGRRESANNIGRYGIDREDAREHE